MNENVTIKTPKRRRWIARLLVSALCILLASSLLFVGVSAENIILTAQFSSNYSIMTSSASSGLFYLTSDIFVYGVGNTLYIQNGDIHLNSISLSFTYNRFGFYSFWLETNTLYVSSCSYTRNNSSTNSMYVEFFVLDISDLAFIPIPEHIVHSSSFGTISSSNMYAVAPFSVENGYFYGILFWYKDSGAFRCYPFYASLTDVSDKYYPIGLYKTVNVSIVGAEQYLANSFFCSNNTIFSLFGGFAFNTVSKSYIATYTPTVSSGFVYEGDYYALSASDLYLLDPVDKTFDIVGSSPRIPYASYASNGVLNCFTSLGSNTVLPYVVYTGLPTSEPPPESSDETTTEPPPESSEESSEPDVTMTKILKYEPGSGGTSVSSVIGEVDLNDAVKVEAFLGRFESSPDNSDWTDSYQNLMLRVTNSDDTEDIYDYDFPAYGYYSGLLSSEVEFSDFVFPGFVGYWFEIPFENGSEISFATKSPGGSVFLYGYNMQLTVNFNSPDSSFRLLFGQDSYSVVLSNIGENSQTVVFEDETVLRYKKFTANGGSSWYAPEEGTFALIPASDVLDPNILLSSIRIETNIDNTLGFPTESFLESVSKWEEYLSRQEEKQDFLNSLAGDAYGQISIDPDTSEAYGDAVDTFSTIVNSEGGSVIFGFFRYMWSVHPLMSSMASLVVTFAIVGFVVRKV